MRVDDGPDAVDDEPTSEADVAQEAWEVVALRDWDRNPPNWDPPENLRPESIKRRARLVTTAALSAFVILAGIFGLNRAWDARDNSSRIAIEGWAAWNFAGYEEKPAWPEFESIMTTMGDLPCGRALWEPSSMEGDPINTYGTSLALELLPYYTDGCIGSMEGLYFESSGTTYYPLPHCRGAGRASVEPGARPRLRHAGRGLRPRREAPPDNSASATT